MPNDQTAWQELEQLLTEEPDELAFRAICSVLDTWEGQDHRRAMEYAAEKLAHWPDDKRVAPWSWCVALAAGAVKSSWALVRTLRLMTMREGCRNVLTEDLSSSPFVQFWTSLHCFPYSFQGDSTADLLAFPEHWQQVRHLYGVKIDKIEQFYQFFSSSLAHHLETLEVHYHVSPSPARPKFDLTDVRLPHPLINLQELCIHFWNGMEITTTLTSEALPNLKTLSLRASWSPDPAPLPESFKELLHLPILSQIRTITIDQYPEDAILTLFSRRDLAFESVSFINRPYTGTVEYQEFAYRLTTAGLDAIIASGAIHSTRHLSVQHERLGDDIVRLVEAIAPESLEILELIDVGLADEGVARLAQLPQLSRITTLSLACNELSAAGVELLTKSTWLKNVRHLDLGSNPYNPYYGFLKAQPIGDAGIAALAKSELITQLHTLHIINADISAVGIATLAQTRGVSNLRHLDLSFNFIGTSGCEALAKSTLLPSLRELHLSRCALDDLAIHHLMQSDFHNLRVLDLSYNSISEVGVQAVASTPHLASLWHLNLHDNFIGDAGLMSLTKSLWLDRLVELDVEQDVWNYRRQQYSHESAISLAQSTTLARLDALWAGVVDEYHFERLLDPFKRNGTQTDTDLVIDSKQLRPEVRYSLQHYREPYDPSPEAEARRQALEKEYKDWLDKYTTPESQEVDRRHHDFRTRPSDMST